MPGLGDNGRVRLQIGKQEHGDDAEAGVSKDIDDAFRRDMAASQVRYNGKRFPGGRLGFRGAACRYSATTARP